jgi:hypothetical protein
MESIFPYVVFGSVGLFLVVGLLSMLTRNNLYDQIGAGGFSTDEHHGHGRWEPAPDSPAAQAEREQEIRQMLQARSERQVRQGQEPIDIDVELARLTNPDRRNPSTGAAADGDSGLNIEVRQLVVARNERRVRRGLEPLDVEAEIQRTLRELSA